jgi:Domain of unknown function (DUF6968)
MSIGSRKRTGIMPSRGAKSIRRARNQLGRVVARRNLCEKGAVNATVTVSIGLPRPDRRSRYGDWECPYLIEGIGPAKVGRAGGVDALQALMLAIQCARAMLEHSGRSIFWLDPDLGPDIPELVPSALGKRFRERVRLSIERETVRAWRERIKSARATIRAEESKLRRHGKLPIKIAKDLNARKRHLDRWSRELDQLKPRWNRPAPPVAPDKR